MFFLWLLPGYWSIGLPASIYPNQASSTSINQYPDGSSSTVTLRASVFRGTISATSWPYGATPSPTYFDYTSPNRSEQLFYFRKPHKKKKKQENKQRACVKQLQLTIALVSLFAPLMSLVLVRPIVPAFLPIL
jgi:hypothetical protein